jgi:hypothetical protein
MSFKLVQMNNINIATKDNGTKKNNFNNSNQRLSANTVSFHSIRRSRVTGGPDGDELWSLSRVTKAVDEYVFRHGFRRKWLQSHIESVKIILWVQRLEIEQ